MDVVSNMLSNAPPSFDSSPNGMTHSSSASPSSRLSSPMTRLTFARSSAMRRQASVVCAYVEIHFANILAVRSLINPFESIYISYIFSSDRMIYRSRWFSFLNAILVPFWDTLPREQADSRRANPQNRFDETREPGSAPPSCSLAKAKAFASCVLGMVYVMWGDRSATSRTIHGSARGESS
jgi:hypothetical protein